MTPQERDQALAIKHAARQEKHERELQKLYAQHDRELQWIAVFYLAIGVFIGTVATILLFHFHPPYPL